MSDRDIPANAGRSMSDLVQRAVAQLRERVDEAREDQAECIGVTDDFLPSVIALMEAVERIPYRAPYTEESTVQARNEALARAILGKRDES